MLEFLVLAELIREDDITFEEYCELIDKYKKIRLEFLNELKTNEAGFLTFGKSI